MKLAIAGIQDTPLLITETPDKGPVIASWQQSDGTFVLPAAFGEQVANELTFEDDKLRAFDGLPSDVRGIWLSYGREESIGTGRQVIVAPSLIESMEYLRTQFL